MDKSVKRKSWISYMNENTSNLVTSNSFVDNVKRWVILDTHLKYINEKTRKMREQRSALNDQICNYLETSNVANKKILVTGGHIKMYEKKEYEPLTFGFLETHLGKIVQDSSQVEFIIQYLKEQRTIKTSNELRHNENKEKQSREIDT
jgi:hypothetical protein